MPKVQKTLREETPASVGVDENLWGMRIITYLFLLASLFILIAFMVSIYSINNEYRWPIVEPSLDSEKNYEGGFVYRED